MKKIISIFMVLSILFMFAGCSTPNAKMTNENITNTVNTAFDALKNFDTTKLDKYVDSTTLSYITSFAKDHKQFQTLGKAMFKNLSVEIGKIDIKNKTVTVTVKNKDLEQVASDFTTDLLSRYSKFQLLAQLNSDSWLDSNLTKLTTSIGSAKMENKGVTVTLTIKQESKNLVLSFNDEAENAVSGGALGAIQKITSGSSATN